MFAKPGQKAWKRVDYVQKYGTLHTDYMALVKMLYAKVDDNRNDCSLLYVD